MAKSSEEDDTDLVDEVSDETVLDTEESSSADTEEEIPDEEGKPVRKKVAALKARHRLEDYFEMKRIQEELDYLDDEEKRKTELLQKVAQAERLHEAKAVRTPRVKPPKVKKPTENKPKPAKPKPKPKPKMKAKSKPKSRKKSKK